MVTLFAVVISRGADNGKAAAAIPTAICEFPRARLDTTTKLPLLQVMEEKAGERRCSGKGRGWRSAEAPLPDPLPALRCGERERAPVVVSSCAQFPIAKPEPLAENPNNHHRP